MKIRILIDAKLLGGLETHVINLYEGLVKQGHDCKIIFLRDYPNNILYTLFKERNIDYTVCNSIKEWTTLLNKDKPDIIHAHGYRANILARIYALFKKTKVVTTFHMGSKPVGRVILYNWLERYSSFLSHNISVNSHIAKTLPTHSAVIPNFVSIPKELNPIRAHPPFSLYFIGRCSEEKGPRRFCQLAERSSSEYQWNMVGDGPLLEECKKKYAQYVRFHNNVTYMESLWQNVDLLCITSTGEGLPMVLLEAMSRGIPVVSFRVGSVAEIIADLAYVVDNYNLSQMQESINRHFKKSIEERQKMAEQARAKIISVYSTDVIIPQIINFYAQLK